MISIYSKSLDDKKALKAKKWLDKKKIKNQIFDFDNALHKNIIHKFFLTRDNCPFFFIQSEGDCFVEFVKDFKTLKKIIKRKEKQDAYIQL